IDLLLGDSETNEILYVLDTKYKVLDTVDNRDRNQVVTYATLLNCKNAILIYPQTLKASIDQQIGDIRVRSLTFSIDSDLNEAGKTFLTSLLPHTLP
ncbi:MAG: restriction endonuclease, partial [Microcoleus sp. T3-bin5]|nr:restriction endonuclease [Microcoleus sp. T3-bin5]